MAEALLIHDPSIDGQRKFVVRVMNKQVTETIDDIDAREMEYEAGVYAPAEAAAEAADPDAPDSAAVRREAIELARAVPEIRDRFIAFDCERLDALTKPLRLKDDDGELTAGEFVTKLWEDGEIAREWITEWVEEAKKKALKRPR